MKQYRITSKDFMSGPEPECVLSSDDPVYEFYVSAALGGLGGSHRISELRLQNIKIDLAKDNTNESQRIHHRG